MREEAPMRGAWRRFVGEAGAGWRRGDGAIDKTQGLTASLQVL